MTLVSFKRVGRSVNFDTSYYSVGGVINEEGFRFIVLGVFLK